MTPIEKNVVVVDELGNRYEDTYIKRAKGLVKHGRARFVDDHTICLACPPNIELEDNLMSENMNINVAAETAQEPAVVSAKSTKYTVEYCLEQMELITLQTEHLMQALEELKGIASVMGGDGAGKGKAQAIESMVKCRETTNQKLIAFYEKVYDDLKPQKPEKVSEKVTIIQMLNAIILDANVPEEVKMDLASGLRGLLQESEAPKFGSPHTAGSFLDSFAKSNFGRK